MKHNFPYLKNSIFLKNFDKLKLKEQHVKLIVLTFDQRPIQEIQGRIVSGNFTLDGSSSMRRTGSLNMIADDYEINLTDTQNLLSMNKKIEVLVGFTNMTDEYQDFPILWFPQGIYIIVGVNITHDSNGVNISLTLHDKMALLNGECGGTLPASVIFSEMQDIDKNGDIQIVQPTIYQIIQELVNHFGGQQLGKIIISDIDNQIKKVMKWTGSTPIYLCTKYENDSNGNQIQYNHLTTNQKEAKEDNNYQEFSYGQDVGYILTDFVYPGELIGNAGDTVVTILDQIKNVLGNYEYFYDIDGNFRFQEIKNYLNTSYSTEILKDIINNKTNASYLVNYAEGKSIYTFDDASIVQSYSNSPQYQQIKNDFIVWGKRLTLTGQEIPIRYHLAIDSRPQYGNKYEVFFFTDPNDGITKAKKPLMFETKKEFPNIGEVEQYYYAEDTKTIYKWASDAQAYESTLYKLTEIITNDYRDELYFSGISSDPFGLNSNYYYTELKNEWPKLYDIQNTDKTNRGFLNDIINQPSDIDFFLDLIDTSAAISKFSVQNIGRRTVTLVDDSINCIFEPDNPNLVIIETGTNEATELRKKCKDRNQEYVQVRSEVYSLLMNGGVLKSAYEEIKKELYQYTNYNQQVSLTTLPVYYLEPNTRITIRDPKSGIYGDYIIKTISLPLDINSTMSITCTKIIERI